MSFASEQAVLARADREYAREMERLTEPAPLPEPEPGAGDVAPITDRDFDIDYQACEDAWIWDIDGRRF